MFPVWYWVVGGFGIQNKGFQMNDMRYAGFWIRLAASMIDVILITAVTLPAMLAVYGLEYFKSDAVIMGYWDFQLNWIFPAVAVIVCWYYRSATPGKILLGLIVVDVETGGKPSLGQLVGRYLGYYLSTLVLGLGFLWIVFGRRKQGWHDKLTRTTVIYASSIRS